MANGCILDFEEIVADLSNCYKVAFSKALGEFGIGFDEGRLQEYIATPLNEIFERYYTGCTCKYRDFVTVFMSAFDRAFPENVVPRPGSIERIRSLKDSGNTIGIIGDTYGMYIGLFLSKYGLDSIVSAVVGIEQMAIPRPDPYSLKLCLSQMSTNAENTLFFAVSEKNKITADKIGMKMDSF